MLGFDALGRLALGQLPEPTSTTLPIGQEVAERAARKRIPQKSESYSGVRPLYAPNPAQPFAQRQWDQAPAKRRKAVGDVWAPPRTIIAPNPAQPFAQYEWRTTARIPRSLKSESYFGNFPIYHPNPALPFRQNLWEGAAKHRTKATGEAVGGDSPLLTPNPPFPFDQYEWRDPARVPRSLKSDCYSPDLPIYLAPPPFAEYDWPAATRLPISAREDFIERLVHTFIATGQDFDYFFLFKSEAEARADAIVGPYFGSPSIRLNIWAYDLSQRMIPPPPDGWWCMIETIGENTNLLKSPNLKYFLIRPQDILFQTYYINGSNQSRVISYDAFKGIYAANWGIQ